MACWAIDRKLWSTIRIVWVTREAAANCLMDRPETGLDGLQRRNPFSLASHIGVQLEVHERMCNSRKGMSVTFGK